MHTSIHVAGTRHDISRGLVAGAAIYNLADIDPARQHLLLELADDRDVPLRPDDYIVINGRERFSIADGPQPADDNPCLRKPLSPTINEQELPADRELHQAKLPSRIPHRLQLSRCTHRPRSAPARRCMHDLWGIPWGVWAGKEQI